MKHMFVMVMVLVLASGGAMACSAEAAVPTPTPGSLRATPGRSGVAAAAPRAPATSASATRRPATSASATRRPSPTVRPSATSGARTWMIQYDGAIDYGQRVDFYNLDGESTTAAQVARLKARGTRVICYINAGAWEPWRADARSFPAAVKGRAMDGWADERWLDVRRLDVLMPIMTKRIQACRAKGFDGIDPDNTDGYGNATGFKLTTGDSLTYLNRLAAVAHSQGMTIGLKNTLELVPQLARTVDFAVNEECLAYGECGAYAPLQALKKPILHIEYEGALADICARSPKASMFTVLAPPDLDGPLRRC